MFFLLLPFLSIPLLVVASPLSRGHKSPTFNRSSSIASTATENPTFSRSLSIAPVATATPPESYPNSSSNCFPAIGFKTPSTVPSSTEEWWCDSATEHAFLGFSYEVSDCQSLAQLQKDFKDIRNKFHSRYIRIYGACATNDRFYNDIITAAWDNSLGVHALIWFGFDGSDRWIKRRDSLFKTLHENEKAKFVIRVVQFGSEPLFDSVLSPGDLTKQVLDAKQHLSSIGIPVTVSELLAGYKQNGGAQDVLDAIDSINIHMLPFFSPRATKGADAWPLVKSDLDWFIKHGKGKKMYLDENGWPSKTSEGVKPNSKHADASVSSEGGYFKVLDNHCPDLKNAVGGGIGWFAHIYSDKQEPGYGIYDDSGVTKFNFAPRTSC